MKRVQGGRTIELEQYIKRYQRAMHTIYRGIGNMIKQYVHEDVTTDQFLTLQYIYQHGSITASEIAQEFGVGRSAITAIVNRLVEKELLIRKRSKEDRRIIALMLSNRGKEVVEATEKAMYRFLQEKLKHFELDDIERLLNSIEKFALLMETDA